MVKFSTYGRISFIVVMFLFCAQSAFAIDEWYKALPLLGNLGQIKKDSVITVQDDVFFDPALKPGQTTYNVKNYLSLKINEASAVLLPDSFSVTIHFKLIATRVDGEGNQYIDSTSIPAGSPYVTITYNKSAVYSNKSVYTFSNAYRAVLRITSIDTIAGIPFSSYAASLMVENEMVVSREYNFSCTNNVVTTVNTDASCVASKGELRVSWAKDRMADEYDLEWTYVDNAALPGDSTNGAPDPKKIFTNNASRVSITNEEYYIPLLYDNTGTLFYRVRPVQVKYSGQRLEAKWSSDWVSTGLGHYIYNGGHEPTLNWQSTTSFAEEGKRKSVVQYYDGSLRSRQIVTKDNTTDTTIVAETLYDYQGRPVIQVLPAPSLSSMIKYSPNFNTDINNAEYDKNKYDDVLTNTNYCGVSAPAMSALAGASNYYSPSNPNKNNGFNKYIPDAKGYPFAETKYTQDNTGRISKQGGVGIDHQIGRTDTVYNDSHETKYYYGSADQEDIDALFGSEAGNASHYFKNMVRDANGQYSVSYVDMHGRTIATALAGKPAASLDSLQSSRIISITKKLIDSVNNIKKGTAIESSKSLVVTKAGTHSFNYLLNADSLRLNGCDNTPVCYDCLYNLTITITDDCNNESLPGNQPYIISDSNFTIGHADTSCNAPVGFSKSFSVSLKEGTYLITKKLSISKYGMDYYRDSIFLVKNTCKTLDDFINQQRQILLSQLDCAPSCAKCSIDTFRNWTLYRPYYMNQLGIAGSDTAAYQSQALVAYNDQLQACNNVCGNTTVANSIRQQMLADVSPPFGQYANPDSIDENSIFALSPTNVPKKYSYNDVDNYADENGKLDTLFKGDGSSVTPKNMGPTEFVGNFKDSWADSLLRLHPEYCKLHLYESNPSFTSSHLWDIQFDNTDTYQAAKDAGFLNPLGYTTVIAQPSSVIRDPFFDNAINPAYANTWRTVMNDSMRLKAKYSGGTFLDMWSLATAMAQCDTGTTACYIHYSGNQYPFDIDTSCRGTLDMAWRYFQRMYKAEKNEIINKILSQTCDAGINIDETKHTLNFPDQSKLNQGTAGSVQSGTDSLNSLINNSCATYASQWWNELAPCNYTSADSAIIVPRLIKVCKEGGDIDHPFGSSTVKPSSSNYYRSFAEVITAYNDSLRTASTPRNIPATACNAYIISSPAAYDNRPSYGNQEVWGKPDSCTCSTINYLYLQYRLNKQTDASFSAYMLRATGTQVSNAVLDSLRNLCDGNIVCKSLVSPLILPPALQCGVRDVCANCGMIATVYTQFQASFPGIVPAYDNTDSTQRANNILFERFMNYNLGFTKQAGDYLAFMDSCKISYPFSNCDSLQKIVNDYNSRVFTAANCDTTHFAVYGNNASVKILKDRYAEIFANGFAHISPGILAGTSYQSQQSLIFKYDTLCVNNDFTIEARIKSDSADIAGSAFCKSVNFVFFDENNNGFSPTFEMPDADPVSCGAGTCHFTGSCNWDTINRKMYYRNLLDWFRVKIVCKNNNASVYVNDTLVTTIAYTTPINKIVRYGSNLTNYGYIDYVKVLDANGTVQYLEEFEDCKQSVTNSPQAFSCTGNCQNAFAAYFNQRKGTSYTYSQVDSVYTSSCGKGPGICPPLPSSFNDSLQSVADKFPCFYNYLDDATVNTGNACNDFSNWITGGITSTGASAIVNRFANLNISNGTLKLPQNLGPVSYGVITYYSTYNQRNFCVNNNYAFEAKIKNPAGTVVQVSTNTTASNNAITETDENFGFGFEQGDGVQWWYNLRGVRTYYDPGAVNRSFNDWRVVKYSVKPSSFQIYLDGVLIKEVPRDGTSTIVAMNGCGFTANVGASLEMDWYKQYQDDSLILSEDFNNFPNLYFNRPDPKYLCPKADCKTAFVNYFRNYYNLGLNTYEKIDSFYTARGLQLGTLCSPSNEITFCGRSVPVFPPVTLQQYSPCDDSTNFAVTTAIMRYQAYTDSLNNTFNDKYLAKCLNAYKSESFTVTQPMSEFHYTLYYYDQAGNLVRTVPPEGVDMTVFSRSSYFDSVQTARNNGTVYKPKHGLKTDYRYNALNQVIAQTTPDAGLSSFWYDRLGRLVVSQNARQKVAGVTENDRQYSYTAYDWLGRINEVGQVNNTTANGAMTDAVSRSGNSLNTWLVNLTNKKEQVTRTFYDLAYPFSNVIPLNAVNLRNRVAYTTLTIDDNTSNYNAGSFYSYDIHGNVDTLLQDFGNSNQLATANIMNRNSNRWIRMVYKYDLISGKVNQVAYNPKYYDITVGSWITPANQFYHRYAYDAENRLTTVETSSDSVIWEKDARYEYYKHGPLARTLLGDQQVQGLDYAYTIQGWLKGVNSTSATSATDMGEDGKTGGPGSNIARDILGYSLNYFGGDYAPINTGADPFPNTSGSLTTKNAYRPLYNGNISSMAVNIKPLNQPFLYNYKYDQLNRLTGMDTYGGLDTVNNNWNAISFTKAYNERVSYDGNGNILKYNRYFDNQSTIMDSLTYHYTANTNKLSSVTDQSQGLVNGARKIKNQSTGNYEYDEIGNLIKDNSENIPLGGIKWNVYGKITEINHSQAGVQTNTKKINYYYDAAGNRIGKKLTKFGTASVNYTWYVRDAQGNVMHVYTASVDTTEADDTDAEKLARLSSANLLLSESHLYGSTRLGILNKQDNAEPSGPAGSLYQYTRGQKFYEISNHLGNVLAVISDRKIGHSSNGSTLDYYNPDVVNVTDYYPFGMPMRGGSLGLGLPGATQSGSDTINGYSVPVDMTLTGNRTSAQPVEYVASNSVEFTGEFESAYNDEFSAYIADASYAGTGNQNGGGGGGSFASNPYRYGFNGKENDGDVKGDGNQIDYGMRVYDPRLGRFFSIDPLVKKYPELSTYQFASNSPIAGIDLDGGEFKFAIFGAQNIASNVIATSISDSKDFAAVGKDPRLGFVTGPLKHFAPAAITADWITGGNLTRFASTIFVIWQSSQVYEYTNRNGNQKDPNIRAENNKMANGALVDLAIGLAGGKLSGSPLSVARSIYTKRLNLATEFLNKAGVPEIERHLAAIHFERDVFTSTLPKGSEVFRYSEIGTTNPKQYFFTELQVAPGEVGKGSMYADPSKYVLEKFTLTKPVKVLNSTVDLANTPGAKQVFSTEIQGASTVQTGTWPEFLKK